MGSPSMRYPKLEEVDTIRFRRKRFTDKVVDTGLLRRLIMLARLLIYVLFQAAFFNSHNS
jgi:hypothetical protein